MDNLLIQVTGSKRVVFFPPTDSQYLYLKGDKSAVLDIDSPDLLRFPLFSQAHRIECQLNAGDILYIPALWFHNVLSLEFGVAVNTFWKNLDDCFYDPKDTYGNKDLMPAARANQIIDRAIKALHQLPGEDYRDFYARQLIARIESKCCIREGNDESNRNSIFFVYQLVSAEALQSSDPSLQQIKSAAEKKEEEEEIEKVSTVHCIIPHWSLVSSSCVS